jgi:hypothetical protein
MHIIFVFKLLAAQSNIHAKPQKAVRIKSYMAGLPCQGENASITKKKQGLIAAIDFAESEPIFM